MKKNEIHNERNIVYLACRLCSSKKRASWNSSVGSSYIFMERTQKICFYVCSCLQALFKNACKFHFFNNPAAGRQLFFIILPSMQTCYVKKICFNFYADNKAENICLFVVFYLVSSQMTE